MAVIQKTKECILLLHECFNNGPAEEMQKIGYGRRTQVKTQKTSTDESRGGAWHDTPAASKQQQTKVMHTSTQSVAEWPG